MRLCNFRGLESLNSVGDDIKIKDNPALSALRGLESLTSVGRLAIESNDALTSVDGFESLTSVKGNLIVNRNRTLTSHWRFSRQ